MSKETEMAGWVLARFNVAGHRQDKHPSKPGIVTIAGEVSKRYQAYRSENQEAGGIQMNRYAILYVAPSPGPDGAADWNAYVPDLSGCYAFGDTREECEALMAEAIPFHTEGLSLAGEAAPPPSTRVSELEVVA